MSEQLLLFLLLPVAAASGWFVARRRGERQRGAQIGKLSRTYFKGVNFLLNEQPDKAIEVFLELAEVDKNTVETHFALGNLFRRRGEVDRAIRVHQNLIARPTLTDEQRTQAVLELGEDFMRAGLLDRAETLFADLVKANTSAPAALRHLISIYQQERDWTKAIEHARRYETATGEPMGKLIAQFQCELAEAARSHGDIPAARAFLAQAYRDDTHCIRAGIVEGNIELAAGNDQAAIRALERVARHDVEYLPEFLKPLLSAYERRGERARARAFLAEMIERYPGVSRAVGADAVDRPGRGPRGRHRFPHAPVAPAPERARAGRLDRSGFGEFAARREGALARTQATHRAARRRHAVVSLRALRLRRARAPLAVPELQELGYGQADPRPGRANSRCRRWRNCGCCRLSPGCSGRSALR